jgi:hypothetical protein
VSILSATPSGPARRGFSSSPGGEAVAEPGRAAGECSLPAAPRALSPFASRSGT